MEGMLLSTSTKDQDLLPQLNYNLAILNKSGNASKVSGFKQLQITNSTFNNLLHMWTKGHLNDIPIAVF